MSIRLALLMMLGFLILGISQAQQPTIYNYTQLDWEIKTKSLKAQAYMLEGINANDDEFFRNQGYDTSSAFWKFMQGLAGGIEVVLEAMAEDPELHRDLVSAVGEYVHSSLDINRWREWFVHKDTDGIIHLNRDVFQLEPGGLWMDCYDGKNLDVLTHSGIIYSEIDFGDDVGSNANCHPKSTGDTYSIVWRGLIYIPVSANDWAFHAQTDDGVRVWLEGYGWIIDSWVDKPCTEVSSSLLSLTRGFRYIYIQYYENLGSSCAHLRWNSSSAGISKQIIPSSYLYPDPDFSVAYAFAYLYFSSAQKLNLSLGSDDGIMAWINGNLVWNNAFACRGLTIDQDNVTVNLNAGWNTLMLRIGDYRGDWKFTARFYVPNTSTVFTDYIISIKDGQTYSPDSSGFIRNWLIIGPFHEDTCACVGRACAEFVDPRDPAKLKGYGRQYLNQISREKLLGNQELLRDYSRAHSWRFRELQEYLARTTKGRADVFQLDLNALWSYANASMDALSSWLKTMNYSLNLYTDSLQEITSGLVGYWRLDDGLGTNAQDSSGKGNNGILRDADPSNADGDIPALWVDGVCAKSLRFDGLDDYVQIDTLSPIQNTNITQFTFSAWVKYISDTGGTQQIFEAHTSTGEIFIEGDFPQVNFVISDNAGVTHSVSATLNHLNRWFHIVGVYDGSEQSLYVDGSKVASVSWSGSFKITTGISLGKDYEAAIQYFHGIMDEVRIYGRALSPDEIYQLYASGASCLGNLKLMNSLLSSLELDLRSRILHGIWQDPEARGNYTQGLVYGYNITQHRARYSLGLADSQMEYVYSSKGDDLMENLARAIKAFARYSSRSSDALRYVLT